MELLIQNLSRFNDQLPSSSSSSSTVPSKPTASELSDLESDSKSIYHLLGVVENLLSFKPGLGWKILECGLLDWLLKRIGRIQENQISTGGGGGFDQNKAYAAEILAILCGNKGDEKVLEKVAREGAIEKVLSVLAVSLSKSSGFASTFDSFENLSEEKTKITLA